MASHFRILDKHILIVDDSATIVLLVQAMLENEGYHNISSASSATEAYKILKKEKIDVILLDIVMPDISGLEATKTIKSNPKYSQIPIIMITATEDNNTLKKSFELGADDFVRKPINQIELIARLSTILQGQEKDAMLIKSSRFNTMEEIMSMLAHQWRQPLSSISSITGSLQIQQELNDLTNEDLSASLLRISNHIQELSSMITTFQGIFKTNEKLVLASANDPIHTVSELMKSTLQKNNISLQLNLSDLPKISYVPNLLVHVLTNIITNAKEAFEKNKVSGSTIVIHSLLVTNDKIYIVIEDNAGGMAPDIIDYIFEPYFTTKKEKNGKGLGLYLSKNIVTQQLHGTISATSKGENSKFLITLPVS